MATAHVSAEPFTLVEVIQLAENQGFTVEISHKDSEGRPTMINLLSADGEGGCHSMSEEDSADGDTHVGSMGDPELDDFEMVAEGSEEYNIICYGDREGDSE